MSQSRSASLDRRAFLEAGAATAFAGALGVRPAPHVVSNQSARRAQNVIFMVTDGIGIGGMTLGEIYRQRQLGGNTRWFDWIRGGASMSLLFTDPAGAIVPDSASVASMWSIGERVANGAISVTPDGRRPTPLLVRARAAGKAIGVVTTYTITDATPAAFYANAASRSDGEDIAGQLLALRPDVVLGGGARRFPADALAPWTDAVVVRTRDELQAGSLPADRPLVGLFAPGPFAFHMERPDTQPSIAELTRTTLDRLSRASDGFVAVIENELTDDGSHGNDPAAMITEFLAFDEALGVALDFAANRDDTLVVATTDHGNANPGLTYGYDAQFDSIANIRHSISWMARQFLERPESERTGAVLAEIVQENTGYSLTAEEIAILDRVVAGEPVDPFAPRSRGGAALASVLSNHHGVAFPSPVHTTDPILATAAGPGSEAMPALGHQVDLHRVVTGALGW